MVGAAIADPVLVELFTSQGCSSCPPADEILGQLTDRDDVVALSLHVDYWDYLGWKDPFASPAFSERQRAYARAAEKTMIYTPQMVVGGRDHVVGTKAMKLAADIQRHAELPDRVQLEVGRTGDTLKIKADMLVDINSDVMVYLVRYDPKKTTKIIKGENSGKTLDYHNVVTDWTALGRWTPSAPLTEEVKISGDNPAVVILQEGMSGPILSVARID